MGSNQDDRYAFSVDWYDHQAALVRRYELLYYTSDGSVEMVDLKNRRMFLKRCKSDAFTIKDLYIGSTITLFGRQLKIVDYGDEFTRKCLGVHKEHTFGFIKPDAINKAGPIFDLILQNGFHFAKLRMMAMDKSDLQRVYASMGSSPDYYRLMDAMSCKPIIAFELVGDLAVSRFKELVGNTDPAVAKSDAPLSIRARFGTDSVSNAIHCSDNSACAKEETALFFPARQARANTAKFADSTLCVIKPHAVACGLTGKIIEAICDCNFELSAMAMFYLDRANAEEFLEVYKGVLAEHAEMVDDLVSGPCVAIEVRAQDAPVVFREFCGPNDPEIARHLRPRTLRARFGKSKVLNAVHCTDLPEDAPLEIEYFFRILDKIC